LSGVNAQGKIIVAGREKILAVKNTRKILNTEKMLKKRQEKT